MNILFYTPINFRCRDMESLAQKFVQEGHTVFFLSNRPRGPFHEAMEAIGARSFSASEAKSFLSKIIFIIRFCFIHNINILYSHLEPTNFVSVIAQFFIKANVVIFRHHTDYARLSGFDTSLTYRLTYFLARRIVAVSTLAVNYMIREEKINPQKVVHIDLGYNFDLYEKPTQGTIESIKAKYPGDLLLISIGRLNKHKRHDFSLEVIRKLNQRNIHAVLMILGSGEDEQRLRKLVEQYNLNTQIHFIGFVTDPLNYLAAADLLIHPSVSESSCVVVKEAALVNLPVIVCSGVGDFDEYMINGENGIVVDKDKFIDEATECMQDYLTNSSTYTKMAEALNKLILKRFSIENTYRQHKELTAL